jgi:hypothetical protein
VSVYPVELYWSLTVSVNTNVQSLDEDGAEPTFLTNLVETQDVIVYQRTTKSHGSVHVIVASAFHGATAKLSIASNGTLGHHPPLVEYVIFSIDIVFYIRNKFNSESQH